MGNNGNNTQTYLLSNNKVLIAGLQGFHGLRRQFALDCFEDEELRFGMGLLLK